PDTGHEHIVGYPVHSIRIDAINGSLIAVQIIDSENLSVMVDVAVCTLFVDGAADRFEERHCLWRDLLPWRFLIEKCDGDMRIAGIFFSIVEETKIAPKVFHKRFAVRFNKHPYAVNVERIANRFR